MSVSLCVWLLVTRMSDSVFKKNIGCLDFSMCVSDTCMGVSFIERQWKDVAEVHSY